MLLGLVLVAPVSQASGIRLYDAKTTYRCLRNKPEYRADPSLQPTKLEFQVDEPHRIVRKHLPFSNITPGPGWDFFITFEGRPSLNHGSGFEMVNVWVFDRMHDASAFWVEELPGWTGKPLTLSRNVFINWGSGIDSPPKQVSSILLGCLRTRS